MNVPVSILVATVSISILHVCNASCSCLLTSARGRLMVYGLSSGGLGFGLPRLICAETEADKKLIKMAKLSMNLIEFLMDFSVVMKADEFIKNMSSSG